MRELDCWALLTDESFVRWVLQPDPSSDRHWENWANQDSKRPEIIIKAKEIILGIRQSASNNGLSEEIWKGIQNELHTESVVQMSFSRKPYRWWMAAAILVLLVGAGTALWIGYRPRVEFLRAAARASHPKGVNVRVICFNETKRPEKVYLIDGSTIILEPHSTLSYARFLDSNVREVTLRGNAFFEIARDPNRPFLVRSGGLVTRVLGTSFRVKADPGTEDVQVAVRTGKVSIYKAADFDKGQKAFCVLLPHQEAVFHKRNQNLAFEPNADAQLLVRPTAEAISMDFDDVPVTDILDQLGKMYHVNIMYDRDSLQQCRLTTSLQEEKLSDKLDIICKAINANYRTQDDHIIINGGHCP
jgi:transmembrane sensor